MQGFFLAVVLGLQRRNTQANHVLALFIALLSIDLLQQIYYIESFYKTYPQLICFINLLPLSYGGFLFLYVRSLTQTMPLRLRDIFHFAFFILGVIVSIPLLSLPGAEKLLLMAQMNNDNAPISVRIFSLIMPLTASIYGVAAYFLLQRHNKKSVQTLFWLRIILVLNMLIWVVVWASIIAPRYLHQLNMTVIYLLVSLVIYMIGYFSLRQPDLFMRDNPSAESAPKDSIKDVTPKYGDNRLPDELREHIWSALENYSREQQPWRESNLTLAQLADRIGIASHHLSQVLNDHHGLSFNDYLNQYRVSAVCHQLQQSTNHTLLDIALSCGFSSKSSFNAIFKKQTGKTPSEYRKDIQTV